jgi:hypothetical protein
MEMKTYIIVYFGLENTHHVFKVVDADHDMAMHAAFKKYYSDWRSADPDSDAIREDFWRNAEVVAIVDAPMNDVDIVYGKLVYDMPPVDPEELSSDPSDE